MKVIVDANIVFSGILNTNGKIGDLLINSQKHFHFLAPYFLRHEIRKHYNKIIAISGMSIGQVEEAEYQITKDITYISEEQITASSWLNAEKLVVDIDPKDTSYVAFSKHFKCKIWSGDKQLTKGLFKKGFKNIITTDELFQIRKILEKK
jgi:predicted nucleic acid-binding protein